MYTYFQRNCSQRSIRCTMWDHTENKTDKKFLIKCCKILDMREEVNCISKQLGCHLHCRAKDQESPPLPHRNYIKAWSLDSVYFHRKQID